MTFDYKTKLLLLLQNRKLEDESNKTFISTYLYRLNLQKTPSIQHRRCCLGLWTESTSHWPITMWLMGSCPRNSNRLMETNNQLSTLYIQGRYCYYSDTLGDNLTRRQSAGTTFLTKRVLFILQKSTGQFLLRTKREIRKGSGVSPSQPFLILTTRKLNWVNFSK